MVSLFKRFGTIIVAKLSKIANAMEDPRETLDFSYEEQLGLLKQVKKGIADVSTAKYTLIQQRDSVKIKIDKYDEQAVAAVKIERDDLAKEALTKKNQQEVSLIEIEKGVANLQREEEILIKTQSEIETKLELFKSKKEVLKAQYTATESLTSINESITGLSDGLMDIGSAVERIEDKTNTMRARSNAITDLIDKGVLTNVMDTGDKIDRELAKANVNVNVDEQLQKIKDSIKVESTKSFTDS